MGKSGRRLKTRKMKRGGAWFDPTSWFKKEDPAAAAVQDTARSADVPAPTAENGLPADLKPEDAKLLGGRRSRRKSRKTRRR